jgi:hypothetical protein
MAAFTVCRALAGSHWRRHRTALRPQHRYFAAAPSGLALEPGLLLAAGGFLISAKILLHLLLVGHENLVVISSPASRCAASRSEY